MEGKGNNMNPQGAVTSNDSGPHYGRILGVIIVLIVLALVVLWFSNTRDAGESAESIGEGKELVRPNRDGAVVSSFPVKLLLEDGVEVVESFAINNSNSGVDQPVVEYTSKLSIEENITLFEDFFRADGWGILVHADPTADGTKFMYAISETEEANVTFTESGGVINVTVSYVLK